MPDRKGTLSVVATPIGNLDDLSPRALETLKSATAIYCEDTRVTAKLASRFGISAPRISCHEHNENARAAQVVERLGRGENVALVSDAGTPGVSDPGETVVRAAADAGYPVLAVPGPAAEMAALSISGIRAVPHLFLGFLPSRRVLRRRALEQARDRPETLVFFEAPHRLRESLDAAAEVLGDRRAVLCREMTKVHEEVVRGSLPEVARKIAQRALPPRGECVVVVEGAPAGKKPAASPPAASPAGRQTLREQAKSLARETGISSREAYRRLSEHDRE
jgi:16S rRNA (cytidine1402-2'-O)-methyltransferase